MSDERRSPDSPLPSNDESPVVFEHPRGTFAIVIIFGALFAVGWLAMYVLRFLARGVPQH